MAVLLLLLLLLTVGAVAAAASGSSWPMRGWTRRSSALGKERLEPAEAEAVSEGTAVGAVEGAGVDMEARDIGAVRKIWAAHSPERKTK